MMRSSPVLAAATLTLLSACGAGSHSHAGAVASPPVPGAREIRVEARSYSFSPAEIHLEPGASANIVLAPVDILHDLTVVGLGTHVVAERGQTATGGVTVPEQPGRYAFVCTVPGHREAGMTGVIVVGPPT